MPSVMLVIYMSLWNPRSSSRIEPETSNMNEQRKLWRICNLLILNVAIIQSQTQGEQTFHSIMSHKGSNQSCGFWWSCFLTLLMQQPWSATCCWKPCYFSEHTTSPIWFLRTSQSDHISCQMCLQPLLRKATKVNNCKHVQLAPKYKFPHYLDLLSAPQS
jgi:hypothetical protein